MNLKKRSMITFISDFHLSTAQGGVILYKIGWFSSGRDEAARLQGSYLQLFGIPYKAVL
jgi:hypothetical protein